jgi:hypothetical protein
MLDFDEDEGNGDDVNDGRLLLLLLFDLFNFDLFTE